MGIAFGKHVELAVGDIILTTDALRGLMDNLLTSEHGKKSLLTFDKTLYILFVSPLDLQSFWLFACSKDHEKSHPTANKRT